MGMKTLVIYHAHCTDGLGAAWAAWKRFGSDAEYVPMSYNRAPPDVVGRDVYLLDFSFKRSVVEQLCEFADHVTIVDHHKTAIEEWVDSEGEKIGQYPMNFHLVYDLRKSGAVLAWDYFMAPFSEPEILRLVQDRDLWQFKHHHTKSLAAYLKQYCKCIADFNGAAAAYANEEARHDILSKGEIIIEAHKQLIDQMITYARLVNLCDNEEEGIDGFYNLTLFSAPGALASDACDAYLKANPSQLHVASYYDTADRRVFSLRGNEGVDLTPIAKSFGGGGHARACSFSVPREHRLAQV